MAMTTENTIKKISTKITVSPAWNY